MGEGCGWEERRRRERRRGSRGPCSGTDVRPQRQVGGLPSWPKKVSHVKQASCFLSWNQRDVWGVDTFP